MKFYCPGCNRNYDQSKVQLRIYRCEWCNEDFEGDCFFKHKCPKKPKAE